MSTIDRLRRMTGEASPPRTAESRDEKIRQLRLRIQHILERRPEPSRRYESSRSPVDLAHVVDGTEVATPYGSVFVATHSYDLYRPFGYRCLGELHRVDMGGLSMLAGDDRLTSCTPQDCLFIDIETTGLAGGTGTFAFLIGVGWIEEHAFITRLVLARDFSEEAAALSLVAGMAHGKKLLVSYNGKAFDLGILAARFILNRLTNPFLDLPHLDLFHPTRRLIGRRLENTRLGTVERAVLGMYRDEDIPSSEIPQRYFRYLTTKDGTLLREVLEHNRYDIVSMALLAAHLNDLIFHGQYAINAESEDAIAAARLHACRGNFWMAEQLLHSLLESRCDKLFGECAKELSLIWKRQGKWIEAVGLWKRMLEKDPFDVFAAEELAKWLEHHQMNFVEAIHIVERALKGCTHSDETIRQALRHRLERLMRKAQHRIR